LLVGSFTVTLECVSSGDEAVSREAAPRPVRRDDMVVPASSFSLMSAHLAWTEITSFAFAAAERRGREDMIGGLHWQMPGVVQ
jgi:hypothetical protein